MGLAPNIRGFVQNGGFVVNQISTFLLFFFIFHNFQLYFLSYCSAFLKTAKNLNYAFLKTKANPYLQDLTEHTYVQLFKINMYI